jgi:hypothetical protein
VNLGSSLNGLPDKVAVLLANPGSNFQAALALYAIIGLALLIVVTVAVMFVLGSSEEEDELETGDADAAGTAVVPVVKEVPRPRAPRWLFPLFTFVAVAILWLGIGYTTTAPSTCTSCHAKTPHSEASRADAHKAVACVACHETGGTVGSYTTAVPGRIAHIAGAILDAKRVPIDYGRVAGAACASCHASDIAKPTFDTPRGLRMSHAEPLKAHATCTDCHRLRNGEVSTRGLGMAVCLRCHDSKRASGECSTCHDKKAAAAARVRKVAPAVQIKTVRCGACHNESRQCDSCHGTRMPHSPEFMAHGHARAGAADLWFNGGRGCAKCHTATRRPCTKCHTAMLGKSHGPALAESHKLGNAQACNSCHAERAYSTSRDFCQLCHSPEAVAGGPR